MVRRILIIAAVIGVLIALLIASQISTTPFHVSGFIEAQDVRLGSRIGGRVAEVPVREGDRVAQGQTLVRLDPYDLADRLAQADAEIARRRAVLDEAMAGFRSEEIDQARAQRDRLNATLERLLAGPRSQEIDGARARLADARARLKLAQSEFQRTETSRASGAATQFEIDGATERVESATANLDMRQSELDLLLAGTRAEDIAEARAALAEADARLALRLAGVRPEEIARARAEFDAATAARSALAQQLDELAITAPLDGVVDALDLEPGDLVAPNAPVLTLIDPTDLWVRAYVPERRLGIALGDRVLVSTDAYPDKRFAAHITFIARQGEFTPSNIQTPEERSKQVFRIKVTLDDGLNLLRPGMAADIWFDEREPSHDAAGSE